MNNLSTDLMRLANELCKDTTCDPESSHICGIAAVKLAKHERLARTIATHNFNQAEVIKEAQELMRE